MDKIRAFLLLLMLVPAGIALAQDDDACQSLVTDAYALTQDACEGIHDGEACYGNARIVAQPANLDFDSVGDRVALADLRSLRLSSINVDQREWGISLMRITANMPAGERPAAVDLVLFGNVAIENAADGTDFAPMQAFYFRTETDDAPCREAPDSGILIQTPRGVGEVTLLVNEVVVDLGSTVYLQTGDDLVFNVVDGQATVTADGAKVTAPEGTFTRVALDDNGNANSPPEFAQPYDPNNLQTLPVNLLPDSITIAEVVGQGDYFSLHDCGGGVWFVPDGSSFSVELSAGGYTTHEAAQNAGLGGVLRIDGGPAIPLSRTRVFSEPRNYHYLAIWDMENVAPGVYFLEGEFNTGIRGTCTMVVGS